MGCRAAGDVLGGSQDYSAQQSHHSSISLCICIFSVLIVVISAFYFILVVNSSSKDYSRLLDYIAEPGPGDRHGCRTVESLTRSGL